MIITTKTTYKEFLQAIEAFDLTVDQLKECFENVQDRALPHDLTYDFNLLIFGKLAQLQRMQTGADMLLNPFYIILEPTGGRLRKWRFHRKIQKLRTGDALRFVHQVNKDMERCAALFNAIRYKADADEIKAGIEKMPGGMHSIADWYARRMGFADVEQVYLIPWTRIYRAMKEDSEHNQYMRRLQKIKSLHAR